MRILHITRSLIKTSGVSVFVSELANAQAELGHEVSVVIRWNPFYGVAPGVRLAVDRNLWRRLRTISRPDIVHVHALWSWYSVSAMLWCWFHRVPFVISPHGGLMPRVFAHGRLKKKFAYRFLLSPLMSRAKAIHCTGEGESSAVAALGLRPRRFVVPLGCNLPPWPVSRVKTDKRQILFLSRISEEKGLLILLDAWRQLKQSTDPSNRAIEQYRLVLAGPDWRGHQTDLEKKILAEMIPDVVFVGNADETMKDELYRGAELFVLPSPMENFSMVVLDALAYGVPVVCTKGTPWKCIEDAGCGWWVEPNSASALVEAIRDATGLSADSRERMSFNARQLAARFAWNVLAKQIVFSYVADETKKGYNIRQ